MSRIAGKCRLPVLPKPLKKPDAPYNPEELSDLEKRWRRLYGQIRNTAFDTDAARQAAMHKRMDYTAAQSEWMLKITDTDTLKPRNSGRMADWLARNFAVEYDDFMQTKLSDVGGVRQRIRTMRSMVETRLADKMAQIETLKAIGDSQHKAQQVLKKLPKEVQTEIWVGAMEEGQLPRLARESGMSPLALRRMNEKHKAFMERALDAGLSDGQVKEVITQATVVSAAYDEALALAKGSGVPMGEVSAIGYFRRRFTPDISGIIAKQKAVMEGGLKNPDQLYQSFQRSRHSYEFLVEDEHLLAYALGRPFESITELVSNPKELTKVLLELPENKLDSLVKMGVVGKIPLTTRELTENLIKTYELPVKGLNEVFITDQVEAYKQYVQNLKDTVSKSTIIQGLLRDGHEVGWAISDVMREANPKLYSGFVPLDPNMVGKFIDIGRANQLHKAGNFYVHPVVRDMLVGTLDLATSPAKMGMMAEVLHHMQFLMSNSKKLMLATPKYVMVNGVGGMIQSFTAGANMVTMVPNYLQFWKVTNKGADVLDNTVKAFAGGTMTERELFQHLKETGGINDFIPAIALKHDMTGFRAWNPLNAQNAVKYAYYTAKRFGLMEGVKSVEELVSNLISEPVMQLGIVANTTDNAFKWNLYKTILADNPVQTAGGFLTTGQIQRFGTDLAGARKHVDRYFFDYSNQGKWDKALSGSVFPFWMYMSRNLPSQMRHMVSQPQQYLAWHRLHQMVNDPVRDDGDRLPAGAVPKYVRDSFPLYFKDGDDYFAVHTTAFDPIADGFVQVERALTDVSRLVGGFTGTDEQQRRQAGDEYRSDFLENYMGSMYPLYKSAVAGLQWLTGEERDFLTNKRLKDDPANPTAFLGVNIPPLARLFLEQNVPVAGVINQVNPGGVFGQSLQYNEKGDVTRMPQRGIFGANRSDRDAKDPMLRAVAPFIGSTGTSFDSYTRALNMGYTEGDMRQLDKKLGQRVKNLMENYPAMDEKAKANAREEMENAKNILFTLRLDLARVKAWRAKYKALPDRDARKKAMQSLSPEQRKQITPLPEDARQIQRTIERFDTFDLMVQEENGRKNGN